MYEPTEAVKQQLKNVTILEKCAEICKENDELCVKSQTALTKNWKLFIKAHEVNIVYAQGVRYEGVAV